MKRQWQERVIIDPEIHHGEPCIKGTRVPVSIIVGSLADGMDFSEILKAYPQLVDGDIFAALAYAADILHQDIIHPIYI